MGMGYGVTAETWFPDKKDSGVITNLVRRSQSFKKAQERLYYRSGL